MEHKPCSFKSYCIKPWISSITELQNGNKKGGKNCLFFPVSPSTALQQDWQWPAHPPHLPSPEAPPVQVGWAPDLGPQASPTSGDQGQGRPLPFPALGAPGTAAKVSGRAGASSALETPCPQAPAQRALFQTPRRLRTPSHLVPTHLGWTWLRQPQEAGGRGETRRAWGGEDPKTCTRARASSQPRASARLPQDTCSARWLGATRRAAADLQGAALLTAKAGWAGPVPPPGARGPGPLGSRGCWGLTARLATAPGGALFLSKVGRVMGSTSATLWTRVSDDDDNNAGEGGGGIAVSECFPASSLGPRETPLEGVSLCLP